MPAEVVNSVTDIGFASRFVELTDAKKEFLERFVELHAEQP